ncbi:somatostatin receptor type 2-like [Cylas formicarius]|uniref:somatostatin receptor type 2-like n=1 Tax=Cylas formicarius TaxID=197179 RepID=UPI0029586CDC|nr:somatostatin receptor type 2-like [Cylas formicarius]XP_060527873.1 somatostatin receptor type 2-like [Cylas formicarius]XP_060527874.1 somatostatin receptor type 2-like [Cylas formicarius]
MDPNATANSTDMENVRTIFPVVVQIIQTILFTVVCLVGLIGNTLVIYVVIRFSKMQTVTNMYIVNLAIADEFFLVGIPFLIATLLNGHWIFGYWACKAYMITTSINQFTSSILLCIMSADRYIAVCHPISSPKWRTPFISKIVSLLAWCCSILLIIPIIEHAKEISDGERSSCVIWWDNSDDENFTQNSTAIDQEIDSSQATVFTLYTFVFSFAIPLALILFFYCEVIKKLKTVGPKNKSKEKKKSHRKVTNLVLTVVTVYVICWLPYWISQLALSNSTMSTFNITLHLLVSCLSYSNSAVNPILYAFLSDNFKKSFLKACTCAANKDVNATLHLENSVFPKKAKQQAEKSRTARNTSLCPTQDDDYDAGPLVKTDASTSAITMTSRTNITSFGDSRDNVSRGGARNGTAGSQSQPTSL